MSDWNFIHEGGDNDSQPIAYRGERAEAVRRFEAAAATYMAGGYSWELDSPAVPYRGTVRASDRAAIARLRVTEGSELS